MKKLTDYSAPSLAVFEIAAEGGIAQSGMTPGQTGTVTYDPSEDNYEF